MSKFFLLTLPLFGTLLASSPTPPDFSNMSPDQVNSYIANQISALPVTPAIPGTVSPELQAADAQDVAALQGMPAQIASLTANNANLTAQVSSLNAQVVTLNDTITSQADQLTSQAQDEANLIATMSTISGVLANQSAQNQSLVTFVTSIAPVMNRLINSIPLSTGDQSIIDSVMSLLPAPEPEPAPTPNSGS